MKYIRKLFRLADPNTQRLLYSVAPHTGAQSAAAAAALCAQREIDKNLKEGGNCA